MRRSLAAWGFAVAAVVSFQALALADKPPKEDPNIRSVEGIVTDANGRAVAGAVIHLKNTKTLQIRSFISKEDGSYSFHGLSTNVEYELKAEHRGATSDVKKLSVFDSRRKVVLDLKLNRTKK
jgi:hypothetical protein